MNQNYVIAEIEQNGRELTIIDTNVIGYEYSQNLYIKVILQSGQSSPFYGMLINFIAVPNGNEEPIPCVLVQEDTATYVQLPGEIFRDSGIVKLSMGGISSNKIVITSNCVELIVDESNKFTVTAGYIEQYWQLEIKKAIDYWYSTEIKAKYDTLVKTAENQQKAVDDKISDINGMLTTGDFDGATILGGIGEPAADLGKLGDWYINQSNVGESAWHIYRKEEAGWTDQRSIIGRDGNNKNLFGADLATAEMLTPFYELHTKAEIIAEQQNLPTESHKISSNDIYYKDSQDEAKTVEKVLDRCLTQSVKNSDLNDVIQDGTYTCVNCTNTPEAAVILSVMTFDTFKIQIANKPNSHNVYKRYYDTSLKTWSGWKLIAGEVLLWEGSVSMGLVNISKDAKMFGHIEFYNNNGAISAGSVNLTKGDIGVKASACEMYDDKYYLYGTTASIGDNTLNLIRSYAYTVGDTKVNVTTTKIVGKP